MKKVEAIIWFTVFTIVAFIWGLISNIIMPVAAFCAVLCQGKIKQWGINCFEGLDNYRSAQCGGDPDESISSRLGKARRKGSKLTFIANKVDLVAFELFGDYNHSEKSVENDEGRKQVTGR